MNFEPMSSEKIRTALAGAENRPEVRAVMSLLKGLEIQSQEGIRIGQPDAERRDISAMTYAYQEAQETIIVAIEEANKAAASTS